eukprot:4392136-Amphidinium_carterae.2
MSAFIFQHDFKDTILCEAKGQPARQGAVCHAWAGASTACWPCKSVTLACRELKSVTNKGARQHIGGQHR